MPRAAIAAAALLAAGCAAEPPAVRVERSGGAVALRAPGVTLDAALTPGGLAGELDAGASLRFTLAPGPLGWSAPTGSLGPLALTWAGDGAGWLGALGDATYRLWLPAERSALAAALDAGDLGPALRAVLPYHRQVRAWLPETRAVFAAAALADPAATADPASWPAVAGDAAQPGMLAGDRPGLGMTCSSEIRCPPEAPICVTPTHAQARGYCTRGCLEDRECDAGTGRCGLGVSDVPGVPGGVTGCYLPCDAGGHCPALLACATDAWLCAPR